MKIIVIGASGLIGSHVFNAAANAGHMVVGTYRKKPIAGLVRCDCADEAATEALILQHRPDAVVYTAGFTWADGCEDDPTRAFEENVHQPERVARLCHKHGIHFTFFSSSYVFDGSQGPYTEAAAPNPINVYGRSKLEAEQRVLAACDGAALIPRVICVYGAEAQRKNFAYQVWDALQQGRILNVPSDQCGSPTWAGDIARWLLSLLERRAAGIWHLGGPWPECARSEWAHKLVTAFQAAGILPRAGFEIRTVPTAELRQRAPRPLKAGIFSNRTLAAGFQPTDFNKTVQDMVSASGDRAGV